MAIFENPGYKDNVGPFLSGTARSAARRVGILLALAIIGAYGWVFFRGPRGLTSLFDKREEIRRLQEQNDALARGNQQLRERIERLDKSRSEQEMEIRRHLKLQRPGETTFILPEGSTPGSSDSNGAPPPEPEPSRDR